MILVIWTQRMEINFKKLINWIIMILVILKFVLTQQMKVIISDYFFQ